MPRFFFDLHDRGNLQKDEEGLSLPDAEAAWFQAVRSARDLIRKDLDPGSCLEGQAVEIIDESGLPVDRLPLLMVARCSV